MLFSSLVFLFFFLPLNLLIYYILPRQLRNYSLLLFSLIFYAWGGVSYASILIISILFNYLIVRQIYAKNRFARLWLIIGIATNISLIIVFKYLDFFIENVNFLAGLFLHDLAIIKKAGIVLPIGISFFTFQQMSMLWDVYRMEKGTKVKFLNTALYISFFPQLIAGPIVRYNDIIDQIRNRTESVELFLSGVRRFILGLFKKIVFANTCAVVADSIFSGQISEINFAVAWVGIIAYSLQIYFDFSGYSDMAIGLGRMFGFRILENFNFPYISKSIKEFWRRWHMSLSSWFRDYVYIPIGGNKFGIRRTYINLMIVFLLTGFWHGATWSFVFWGVFHGLFLIIERVGFGNFLQKIPGVFSWLYTMLVVIVGWVFFRVENISDAFDYLGRMTDVKGAEMLSVFKYVDNEKVIIMAIALISSSTIFLRFRDKISTINSLKPYYMMVADLSLTAMLLYSVMYINSGSYNPFIYFRF